jgi:hypothetical protein
VSGNFLLRFIASSSSARRVPGTTREGADMGRWMNTTKHHESYDRRHHHKKDEDRRHEEKKDRD